MGRDASASGDGESGERIEEQAQQLYQPAAARAVSGAVEDRPAPLIVIAPEKAATLEEVVGLKAAVAVAAVMVVPAEEPAAMAAAQHARETVRRDAAQHSLRQRAAQ